MSQAAASLPLIQAQPTAEATFDPLVHPSLSRIRSFMEEDDEEANFSLGDLLAFRARASELAAILNEDSPSLRSGLTSKAQPDASAVCMSERVSSSGSHVLSYESPNGSLMLHVQAGFSLTLSDRLQPPRTFAIRLSWFLSWRLLDEALFRKSSSRPRLKRSSEMEETYGDGLDNAIVTIGLSNDGRRVESEPSSGAIVAVNLSNGGRRVEKRLRDSSSSKPLKERSVYTCSAPRACEHDIHLNDLLVRCAKAVGLDDKRLAVEMLVKVRQHASPNGNAAERIAYYFAEALEARMAGTGWPIYLGHLSIHRPPVDAILKSITMYRNDSPFVKASRFFTNRKILDFAKDASTLHILEFQLTGSEYLALFKALAARPGGPPQVRLVAANDPRCAWSTKKKEEVLDMLQQVGHRLAACAVKYGVPFHYTAWVGDTTIFRAQDYFNANRRTEEVLLILSRYLMRFTYDDILNPPGKSVEIFKTIQPLKPEAYIYAITTGSYSMPYFTRRFEEALNHFSCHYEALDTFVHKDFGPRIVFEREVLGKAVLHIVACEDTNVVQRVDKHKQWYADMKMAGLRQMKLDEEMKVKVERILKSWHDDYVVDEDLNYLLLGWRGRILYALSAWTGKSQ